MSPLLRYEGVIWPFPNGEFSRQMPTDNKQSEKDMTLANDDSYDSCRRCTEQQNSGSLAA